MPRLELQQRLPVIAQRVGRCAAALFQMLEKFGHGGVGPGLRRGGRHDVRASMGRVRGFVSIAFFISVQQQIDVADT